MRKGKLIAAAIVVVLLGFGVIWLARSILHSIDRSDALQLADQRRYQEAIPGLETAVERDSDDIEALQKLVQCLLASGADRAEVLPWLSRWCELEPRAAVPFVLRMQALIELGRSEEALADAQYVLELYPEEHAARWAAAQLLRDAGRHEESEKECQHLLQTEARPRVEVLMVLTQNLLARDQLTAAIDATDRVLRERPNFEAALLYKGMARSKQGKMEDAITLLERASQSADHGIRQAALSHLAECFEKQGQRDRAAEIRRKLASP